MRKWNDPVSADQGMLVIIGLALAGLIVGLIPGNALAIAFIALSFVGMAVCVDHSPKLQNDLGVVLTLGMFACLATALVTTGLRLFVTTPGLPLMAFWLYALIAAGFISARCCLGWHIGAAAAVLTSFVAAGLWVRSFFGGGMEWLILLIVAAGLGWGADSWRRANSLAVNE